MPYAALSFLFGFIAILVVSHDLGFFFDDWWMLPLTGALIVKGDWVFPLLVQTSSTAGLGQFYGYRPLAFYFIYLLYGLFGYNPLGYHVAKSIIHGFLTLMYFLLIRRFVSSDRFAFLSSIFVTLTGSVVYSSMWITNPEPSAEVFFIAGLVLFFQYLDSVKTAKHEGSKQVLLLLGIIAATVMGSWFKDTGRGLPLVMIGYSLIVLRARISRPLALCLASSLFLAIFPSSIPMLILTGTAGSTTLSFINRGPASFTYQILLQNAFHNLTFVYYQIGIVSALLGVLSLKTASNRLKLLALPAIWFSLTYLPTIVAEAPRLDLLMAPALGVFTGILILTHSSLRLPRLKRPLRILLVALFIYALLIQVSLGYVQTNQVWGTYWRENQSVQAWAFKIRSGTVVFDSAAGYQEFPKTNPFNPAVTFTDSLSALNATQGPVYACSNTNSPLREYILTHPNSFQVVYRHETDAWYFNLYPSRLQTDLLVNATASTTCWQQTNRT